MALIVGTNDLATLSPELAAEWHPTKNGDLAPAQVTLQSNRKVWWRGKCGHEWDARIPQRTIKGAGCPYCAGRRVLVGFNDLATVEPALATQWHPTKNGILTAQQVIAGGKRKVWWLGNCNHEWETVIERRVRGSGCPVCVGKQVVFGFNDLATTKPMIAAEWHPTKNGTLTAQQIIAGSHMKVWWLGSCNHAWEASIINRTRRGDKCPHCSGVRVLIGFNDLATTDPMLASEWHPTKNEEITPEEVSRGSNKKVWWRGICGHEWDATPADRINSYGCPICSNHRVLGGFNDLATKNPELAAQWHPIKNGDLTAKQVTVSSHRKAWWLGECGHEWEMIISNRTKGYGCLVCAGFIVLIGFNDLATTNPMIAADFHPTKNGGLTANQITAGTPKKVWWLGTSCGHEWKTTVGKRTLRGDGCPVCSNQRLLTGFNDLATINPVLASEWHPTKNGELTAQQIIAGSGRKIWWLGTCNHEWEAAASSRMTGAGCSRCVNQVSKPEEHIKEYLAGLGLAVEGSNWTALKPKRSQLDIYILSQKIAIEFNGIHWHKEKYKGRNSHYNKWMDCKNKGIQLIQIWEDDWNLRPEIIMKSLAHKLGISETGQMGEAKATSITNQQAEVFLKENHLQGFASGSYYIGLVKQGEVEKLQAVMVLEESNSEDDSIEIIRYASISNNIKVFSKLLSYAINAYSPESITVIADHCEANEELYARNGFIAEKEISPDYMYVIRTERKPKTDYSIERFRDDPKLLWEEGLTEMELADLNSLNRIWNAGKTQYRLLTSNI